MFRFYDRQAAKNFSTQCDQIGQNFAIFAKSSKSLAIFWRLTSYLGKIWTDFGKFCMPLGQFSLIVNGQMLKNNLAIWSHCSCEVAE